MNNFPKSFGDARLYQKDIKSLEPGQWLTTEALYFGLQGLPAIDPSLARLILTTDDWEDLCEISGQLLDNRILVPVMNQSENHWYLLAYSDEKCIVIDSMRTNDKNAELIAKKIRAIRFKDYTLINTDISIYEKFTPPQNNNYDCGVYVIMIIRTIVQQGDEPWDLSSITPTAVTELRKQLLNEALK